MSRRRQGMRPVDYVWVIVWIALALGVRWYLTGEPPWPTEFRWEQ